MIHGLLLLSGRLWGLRAAPRVYRLTRTMVKEHKHHVTAWPSSSRGLFGVAGLARANCFAGLLSGVKPALGGKGQGPACLSTIVAVSRDFLGYIYGVLLSLQERTLQTRNMEYAARMADWLCGPAE